MGTQVEPIYFVSITTTPDLTKAIIADLVQQIKEEYDLVLVAITTTIEGLEPLLKALVVVPQLLICSSQWTSEEQQTAFGIGRAIHSNIKTIAVPPGLNALKGGPAVASYLNGQVRGIGLPKRA